jgi:hypothetical protein
MNSILKRCFNKILAVSLESCQEFCVEEWVELARRTAVARLARVQSGSKLPHSKRTAQHYQLTGATRYGDRW